MESHSLDEHLAHVSEYKYLPNEPAVGTAQQLLIWSPHTVPLMVHFLNMQFWGHSSSSNSKPRVAF
jgi:hypothetical protein